MNNLFKNNTGIYKHQYYFSLNTCNIANNIRIIVDQNRKVKETNDYYAFGSRWVDASSIVASPANRYRYNGMEEQNWCNLSYYYNVRFDNPALKPIFVW